MSVLREDEEFVISAVASQFGGTWGPGENPPDAYLTIAGETIAVEISTLTQQITDDQGTRARLSDDTATAALANELNEELSDVIPQGSRIGLVLSSPILEFRKTKARLGRKIRDYIADASASVDDREVNIFENKITIFRYDHGDIGNKKVTAIFSHRNSSPDLLNNAWTILEDRITTKNGKCRNISAAVRLWLALRNDYWLCEVDTYQYALSRMNVVHRFERILVINGDRSVHEIGHQAEGAEIN